MKLTIGEIDGFSMIGCAGDLNDTAAMEFLNCAVEMLEKGTANIIVNLSNVAFLSSHGLGCIVKLWKKVAEANGMLCVISDKENINTVLEHTNLTLIIDLYTSEETFRKRIKGQRDGSFTVNIRESGTTGKYAVVSISESRRIQLDAEKLRQALNRLTGDGARFIAVDMAAVTHIYTDMIGVFISVAKKVKLSGGEFCIINAGRDVRQALEFAGISDYLNVHSDSSGIDR